MEASSFPADCEAALQKYSLHLHVIPDLPARLWLPSALTIRSFHANALEKWDHDCKRVQQPSAPGVQMMRRRLSCFCCCGRLARGLRYGRYSRSDPVALAVSPSTPARHLAKKDSAARADARKLVDRCHRRAFWLAVLSTLDDPQPGKRYSSHANTDSVDQRPPLAFLSGAGMNSFRFYLMAWVQLTTNGR